MNAWILNKNKELEFKEIALIKAANSTHKEKYTVILCGICRTDAKLCVQGHRDLSLPRIPGHEICVEDDNGQAYTVWPGESCGKCKQCLMNMENLCSEMKITGFHNDGGFAPSIFLNKNSLIKIPEDIPISSSVFAEPLACAVNAIKRIPSIQTDSTILITGAGVCGLLFALAAEYFGLKATILEKAQQKQTKVSKALKYLNANLISDNQLEKHSYDYAVNTAAGTDAFETSLHSLKPGGTLLFFSGINNSEKIPVSFFNEIHYRQLTLSGAYGCRKSDMEQALKIMKNKDDFFTSLIEKYIKHEEVGETISKVYSGQYLRFIIDYRK